MKKIIFGILLLAVLAVISYVKVYRDREQVTQARQDGVAQGEAALSTHAQEVDSLKALMERRERELADSLVSRDIQHAELTDSLRSAMDEQCEQIESLKRQAQKAKSQPSKKAAAPAKKADSGDNSAAKAAHKDILAYYTEQVDKLPKDLSDYERRVALREVREETAKKFAITAQRLDEIRKQYSLDY